MRARWTRFAKCSGFLLIPALAATSAFGQTPAEPASPNLEILKLHWEKQIRLPRNFDPSVVSTSGAFTDPSRGSITSPNTATVAAPSTASGPASGDSGLPNPFPATPARMPIDYVYSMKIKNTSPKTIEGIAWDYLFLDRNNLTERGRHQFLSYAKIPTDKSMTLQGRLRTPPIRIVQALPAAVSIPTSGKQTKSIERVAIKCILYADNSVWRNPQARKDVCEFLKSQETLVKRKRT